MSELLEFFKSRTDSIIQQLETLVHYESPSEDKTLNDLLGEYCLHQFQKLGAQVQIFPRETVGDILLGKWNTEAQGKPLLILTHRDTVWAQGTVAHKIPFRRDEYKLYGAGVLDMKAGIAIAWEAIAGLQALNAFPNRPIWMLITSDEESGSTHSRELIVDLSRQAALCLVMEPSGENEGLKSARKGIARYWISAKGRASHAGAAPEEGINAILELAHQTIALQALNQLRQGTSVSVTQIQGGSANNVIPESASLYTDVRFFYREEAERVHAAITELEPALMGCELEIKGGIDRYPMERNEEMVRAVQQAQQIAADLGLSLGEATVGGVSDGNLTASAGVPTLDGLGGHGEGMHALHEHVLIRSLWRRAALVANLLKQWPLVD